MSHRPPVCLLYRAWMYFATIPMAKWMQAEAAFCFGGVRVIPWSVGKGASHHTGVGCFFLHMQVQDA